MGRDRVGIGGGGVVYREEIMVNEDCSRKGLCTAQCDPFLGHRSSLIGGQKVFGWLVFLTESSERAKVY